MFKLKNYIIIKDEHSRQYQVAIDLELFNFLITNFKVDLYQFKLIYRLLQVI